MVNHTLVLYPSPAMGHLISMVELGKLILKHHPSLSITILIANPPFNTGATSPYISQVSQTFPLIHFHHLPTVSLPLDSSNSTSHESIVFLFLQFINPIVRQALQTILETNTVKALIIDMFCSEALEVGQTLKIPTFFFFTSGISAFATYLYFPTMFENPAQSVEDLNTQFHVPGVPPFLLSDFPNVLLDRKANNRAHQGFLHSSTSMLKSQGIIVNSFESLEPRPLKAIREGLCVPGAPTPTVLNALLPDGFLDRTKDRGQVLTSWAPQVEVLSHEAVGGFVTHCGWNSVLEAICAGVPMVAWPLYAEQRLNRVFLVAEMKIAFPLVEGKDGFVNANEIERRVRQLMESEEGTMVRQQIIRMSESAKAAINEGGASLKNLSELVLELYRISDDGANWA